MSTHAMDEHAMQPVGFSREGTLTQAATCVSLGGFMPSDKPGTEGRTPCDVPQTRSLEGQIHRDRRQMVVRRGWGTGGSECLMGTEVQFGTRRKSWT